MTRILPVLQDLPAQNAMELIQMTVQAIMALECLRLAQMVRIYLLFSVMTTMLSVKNRQLMEKSLFTTLNSITLDKVIQTYHNVRTM